MVAATQAQGDAIFTNRASAWLVMGGRLKEGSSVSMAAAEVEAIGRDLARDHTDTMGSRGLRLLPSSSVPGNQRMVAAFVALLTGIVSLVLLVACANLSGLLLARAATRRREIAVRLAVGAGRARLVRQLMMETIVLFVLGGVAGLVLARVMTTMLVARLPALPFPVAVSLALDMRVIAFTAGLSLIAALASGLNPALQASAGDPVVDLKDGAHGPPGRSRLRHAFVVAQIAFTIVLVVSAGLFGRALARAGSANPGFDPRGVELASLDLSMAGYTFVTAPRFAHELIGRVRQLPNVEAATIARVLPGGFETTRLAGLAVPAGAQFGGEDVFYPDWNIVEPDYFATLRIPLVSGRDFNTTDRIGSPRVAIIDENLARRFWPDENPIGRSLVQRIGGTDGGTLLVIGVAGHIRSSSLIDGLSEALLYVPLQQQESSPLTSNLTIAVRTRDGQRMAEPIRMLVRSMDANLPVVASQTLEEAMALGLVPQRVAASISGSLGLVALLLAAIGIYGVTAYAVARRTRYIGMGVALGAARADVVGMVLRHGMALTIIGSLIGVALAAGASQLLAAWLLGVPPLDPVAFTIAVTMSVMVGLAACYIPARRATEVDPMIAVRSE
jgi:predicted permease